MIPPISLRYEGDGEFVASHRVVADRHFVVGQRYVLVEHQERSRASHDHFFATVSEAWSSLPEAFAERFATPGALRKWCLIATGFRDERSIVAASKAEALRVAAFIKPMDDFAVVRTDGALVLVYTAKSQSVKAMGKADFQRSKQAVLDKLAEMLGVTSEDLAKVREAA